MKLMRMLMSVTTTRTPKEPGGDIPTPAGERIAEKFWTPSTQEAVQASLADAKKAQMTVVAAAGDGLATAGLADGGAHLLFPSSSPLVLACGGTGRSEERRGGE